MALKVDKIFISCVISILVILQIKHGRHISRLYFNSSQQRDYAHGIPIIEGHVDLESKYDKVLNELKLLRRSLVLNSEDTNVATFADTSKSTDVSKKAKNDGVEFSACLIVKDENQKLPGKINIPSE